MKAVITGATRGVGKEIAKLLSKNGFNLVLLARNKQDLSALSNELRSSVSKIEYLPIDFEQPNFIEVLRQHTILFQNTTVLVNNVGLYQTDHVSALNEEILDKLLQVNLKSAIGLTNFLSNQKGLSNIINIGSIMSIKSSAEAVSYSISKHALKGWNDALREGLKSKNIKVTAIYPGAINTSSWDGVEVDRTAMIQPEDIANSVDLILKMNKNTVLEEIRLMPKNFSA